MYRNKPTHLLISTVWSCRTTWSSSVWVTHSPTKCHTLIAMVFFLKWLSVFRLLLKALEYCTIINTINNFVNLVGMCALQEHIPLIMSACTRRLEQWVRAALQGLWDHLPNPKRAAQSPLIDEVRKITSTQLEMMIVTWISNIWVCLCVCLRACLCMFLW